MWEISTGCFDRSAPQPQGKRGNFMYPIDRVLEFITDCKFSARRSLWQTFGVQNLEENSAHHNFRWTEIRQLIQRIAVAEGFKPDRKFIGVFIFMYSQTDLRWGSTMCPFRFKKWWRRSCKQLGFYLRREVVARWVRLRSSNCAAFDRWRLSRCRWSRQVRVQRVWPAPALVWALTAPLAATLWSRRAAHCPLCWCPPTPATNRRCRCMSDGLLNSQSQRRHREKCVLAFSVIASVKSVDFKIINQ